jgi:RNA recognition motif-containing protein
MFPGQPWHPTDQWLNPFGPFGPHNAPPAPPPKEPSTDFHGPSDIPEKKVLFVGNVGFNVTERMIQDVFASKGFIVSVRLPRDSDTGMHAGFGYLEFPSIHPAMAAMDALQGVHIDGHAINLEFSDDTIIDSVHPPERPGQERTLYETFASHGHPGSQDSGVSAGQPARPRRASRRKSVTFQEPDLSSLNIQDQDTNTSDGPIRLQSPALIDLTADDTVPNHQPNEVQDQLPEMSRFPPVSQLEAQLFANHQQSIDFDAMTRQEANESTRSLDYDLPKSFYDPVPSGPSLRRSNTVAFAPRGDFSDNPNPVFPSNPSTKSPLRRRASECHSLRRDTHDSNETDTWARLDRRERRRSRRSSQQSIPGSFPLEEPSQPAEPSPLNFSAGPEETDIDRCVSSLVDMGFGTAEDGGRARMAVYAAASNGNLYDAIDMIEEERKAYARQGRY